MDEGTTPSLLPSLIFEIGNTITARLFSSQSATFAINSLPAVDGQAISSVSGERGGKERRSTEKLDCS